MKDIMRNRRGSQIVEFAMILPVFLIIVFGGIDFTWYILQRFSITDAVASGCRAGALTGVDEEADPALAAGTAIMDNLEKIPMIDCSISNCSININEVAAYSPKNRQIECQVNMTIDPMSGFVPGIPTEVSATSTWPIELPRQEPEDTGV